jgi:hypothetical protein
MLTGTGKTGREKRRVARLRKESQGRRSAGSHSRLIARWVAP